MPTAIELYAEFPYRVADSFTSSDGYLRAHLAQPWFLVSPMAGVGFDATSEPNEPTKPAHPGTDAYLTLGLGYWTYGFSLVAEHRIRTGDQRTDDRLTAVYGDIWYFGRWLVEPYVEGVAWREKDGHDQIADGFVRGGYRFATHGATGLFADLLAEPYATVSAGKLPLDNRAELRLGPRVGWLTGVGDKGAFGVNLYAQGVAGRFLRDVPAADAPGRYDSRSYWTQRYLIALGGAF